MIVVDTNVLSELTRDEPEPAVLAWMDAEPVAELFITAVTAAELLYGLERLPAGRRRSALGLAVGQMLEEDFANRILPFTAGAALAYGRIVVEREHSGRPIGMADAMIAATALEAGAQSLATRNLRNFAGAGLALVDPWASAA